MIFLVHSFQYVFEVVSAVAPPCPHRIFARWARRPTCFGTRPVGYDPLYFNATTGKLKDWTGLTGKSDRTEKARTDVGRWQL
jgi:hypothetical protein